MYLPARAFNSYQMWSDYDREVIERDLGYAASVNLNAVRTWLCYEHWLEDPEAHGRALEHFLRAADERDIRVLLGVFEGVGEPPTEENLENTNPVDAVGVFSPSGDVVRNPDLWDRPREFVRWVMDRHRDDDRLLAIEIMNEPGWTIQKSFARGMHETLREERGDVPLTVGSTSLANNTDYAEWGVDALQFHYNFPSNAAILNDVLDQATSMQEATSKPVWFAEWQRIRTGRGFHSKVEGDEWQPDYSSMAPHIHRAGVGNFFWTLMVQPAYTVAQRKQGVLVGLFHEDGAVWDLEDARSIKAMSGDPSVDHLEERKEWPEWAAAAEGGT
ncbi:glycoside hydrolase [Halorarum salinum]|uniref:Glycoside hydrolase n=1 Tax=Halorarum salinum TaxID=2743089 RepID=A0A7D5QIZ4_9EURY|nr:glycoside hydrolase [Halobaculum salinum]